MPMILPTVLPVDFKQSQHTDALWLMMNLYAIDPMGGGVALPDTQHATFLQQMADWQTQRAAVILLAWCDQQPVGLLNAFEGFSTFAARRLLNIHDVIVHPNHRGQGIAGLLLAAAETIAQQRGYCKMTLEVLQGNQSAQALYRKVGFAGYTLDPAQGQALFWQKFL